MRWLEVSTCTCVWALWSMTLKVISLHICRLIFLNVVTWDCIRWKSASFVSICKAVCFERFWAPSIQLTTSDAALCRTTDAAIRTTSACSAVSTIGTYGAVCLVDHADNPFCSTGRRTTVLAPIRLCFRSRNLRTMLPTWIFRIIRHVANSHHALIVVHATFNVIDSAFTVVHVAFAVVHAAITVVHAAITVVHAAITVVHVAFTAVHAATTVVHAAFTVVHAVVTVVHAAIACTCCLHRGAYSITVVHTAFTVAHPASLRCTLPSVWCILPSLRCTLPSLWCPLPSL